MRAFAKERHSNKYGVFCIILLRYRDAGGKLRTKLALTSHTPTYTLLHIKEPSYSFQTRTVPRAVRGHVLDRRAHAGCPAPDQMRGIPAPHSAIDGDCAAVLVLGCDNGDDIMAFLGRPPGCQLLRQRKENLSMSGTPAQVARKF